MENLRGLAMMLDGNLAGATTAFDRALTLDGSLGQARLNRGVAHLRLGQFAKASADFEKLAADEKSPFRADASYHNAIALDRLGRTADAEKSLERALTLDAKLDGALLYLGMLRERRGDLQNAGRAYLDYLKVHPDSVMAMLRFGISAQRAGRVDVARSYLRRVIELAPPNAPEALEARKFLVMWE